MTPRQSLKICRLTVAVLLFNILSSVALASASQSTHYAWMCTSQGLVKVMLSADSTAESTQSTQIEHCPYCKLVDPPAVPADDHLGYPQPVDAVLPDYCNPAVRMTLRPILSAVQLRAPPQPHF